MKTNREQLLKDLSLVKAGLASKEQIEQSTSFVFSKGRVYTYNDEIAVSHPTDIDLYGAVMANEFMSLLNKCTDEELDLAEVKGGLSIQGKKFDAEIKLEVEITLPLDEFKIPSDFKPLPKDFAQAVKFCLFSCSGDLTKPALTCVHATVDRVESCDNFRLTVRYFDEGTNYFPEPLLLPFNAAKELTSFPAVEYAVENGWIHFRTEEDTVFSCRTFQDIEYPDLHKFMDMEGAVLKLPSDLKEVLERASIFSANKIKSDQRIKVNLTEGKLTVFGEGDAGWFEESCRVRYKGCDTCFEINPDFMISILDLSDDAEVGVDRLKLESEDFVHVVYLLAAK